MIANEKESKTLELKTFLKEVSEDWEKELLAGTDDLEFTFREFPPTKKISTYLYAIVAGPYSEIVNKEEYKNVTFFSDNLDPNEFVLQRIPT